MPGQYDSSETRVQPVFKQLYSHDGTGTSWLVPILNLASRANEVHLPQGNEWTGSLRGRIEFEHGVLSPQDYLEFLVEHPERLNWEELDKGKPSPITLQRRNGIRDSDET